MENNAAPPSSALPVCAMNASTAKSGAVMHAPTTSADNAPMTTTAATFPPERFCDAWLTLFCQRAGNAISTPAISVSAKTASSTPNAPSTQGFWSHAPRLCPIIAASTPSAV